MLGFGGQGFPKGGHPNNLDEYKRKQSGELPDVLVDRESVFEKGLKDGIDQNFSAGIKTKSPEDHLVGGGDRNGVITDDEQAGDDSCGKSEMIAAIEFEPLGRSPVAARCHCHETNNEGRGDSQRAPSEAPDALVRFQRDLENFGGGECRCEKSNAFRIPSESISGGRICPPDGIDNHEEGDLAKVETYVDSEKRQLAKISLREQKNQHKQLFQSTAGP